MKWNAALVGHRPLAWHIREAAGVRDLALPGFLPRSFYSDCLALSHHNQESSGVRHALLFPFLQLKLAKTGAIVRFHGMLQGPYFVYLFFGIYGAAFVLAQASVLNCNLSWGLPSEAFLLLIWLLLALLTVMPFLYIVGERRCRLFSMLVNISFRSSLFMNSDRLRFRFVLEPRIKVSDLVSTRHLTSRSSYRERASAFLGLKAQVHTRATFSS